MNFIANISDAINNYDEGFVSEMEWEVLGKPGTTIRDFASK